MDVPSSPTPQKAPAFPRPLPKLEGDALPFWRGLAERRIELPRCRACARWIFYPRPFCPHCLAPEVSWERVEGRGTIYTCTIVRKPTNPYFFAEAPYVYAVVELDCGVRLPTRIVGCAPDDVRVGARVEARFERVNDEVTLLHFAPS